MANEEKIEKIRVTQIRSVAGRTKRTRRTLEALGLGKIGKSKEIPLNAATRGMVVSVRHLVNVEAAA